MTADKYKFFQSGKDFYELGKYEDAIEKFKKCIELDPNYTDAYYEWGNSLQELEKYEDAIEKFKKGPDHVDKYHSWGELLFYLKYYDEAIEKFKKCIELDSDYAVAHHWIGNIFELQGRYKEAKEEWDKTRDVYERIKEKAIKEKNIDFFRNFGKLLCCDIGDVEGAESVYKEGLEIDINDIDILLSLVHLYTVHKDENDPGAYWFGRMKYEKVKSILKDRLSVAENDVVLFQLGDLFLEVGEYEEAEKCLLKSFEKDMKSADICLDLGILYFNMDDFKKAIKYFRLGLKIDPYYLTIKSFLADAYLKEKLIDDAEMEYKEILNIAPYYIESLIGLGEVYTCKGDDSDDKDMYDEAIDYFTKALNMTSLEKEKVSTEFKKRKLGDVYYSRGYARTKLYEARTIRDDNLLYNAKKDFENCIENDHLNSKAKRLKEKINEELGSFSSLNMIEKIGPWLIVGLSILIFILSQYSFFIEKPRFIDNGFYVLLTFGPLIFIIVGLYLPQIFKLKIAGIEIEKSPFQIAHHKIFKIKSPKDRA